MPSRFLSRPLAVVCAARLVPAFHSLLRLPGRPPLRRSGVAVSMSTAAPYDPAAVEGKWQRHWDETHAFRAERRPGRPKKYVLDMFPYPSGTGLHVGHPEGYTATDVMARYWRMTGHDVLHPMGWDSFGLPAEQHAINTGTHPKATTDANIQNFKRQLKSLGFSYDWDRELATTDEDYIKWTQWIFLQVRCRSGRGRGGSGGQRLAVRSGRRRRW